MALAEMDKIQYSQLKIQQSAEQNTFLTVIQSEIHG